MASDGGGAGRRAVVQAQEGQFWIASGGAPLVVDASDLGQVMLVDDVPQAVLVLTGAFEGPVEVRVAAGVSEPMVGDEWEEVVEFSITTTDGLGVIEPFGEPRLTITEESGPFRVRLSARGRAAGQARYSSGSRSKVLEYFLIEVWPSSPQPPEVLRAIERPPPPEPIVLQFSEAGRQGAVRIARDLRRAPGSRVLSGERGTTRVTYEFPVSRRKLYGAFAWNVIDFWVTPYDDAELVNADGLSPQLAIHGGGRVFWDGIESVRPRSGTLSWDWRVPICPPTTVRFDLTEHKEPGGVSTTAIIEHTGLPVEWLDDMTAFWRWRLEWLDRATDLCGPPPPVAQQRAL